MSLNVWNSPADPYDHTQLEDNWLKVDLHDHSAGRGVQIGSGGIIDSAILANHIAPNSIASIALQTGAVQSPSLKPTRGFQGANPGVYNLTSTTVDIPGATVNITPTVASTVAVHGVFDILAQPGATAGQTEVDGILTVDGVAQTRIAHLIFSIPTGAGAFNSEVTVYQVWEVPLTAASHTVKLQAKLGTATEPGSSGSVIGENTGFFYTLYAS